MNVTLPGPVAVGGVSGSGTRVVAQILLEIGMYLGADLNISNDNVWFTVLFRNPLWYAHHTEQAMKWRLSIFERAMTGQLTPTPREWLTIAYASASITYQHRNWKNIRYLKRIYTFMRSSRVDLSHYVAWGWKEPTTQLYVRHLSAYFPTLKYLQVIRHGLDMAYSSDQQQGANWGKRLFGIEPPRTPEQSAQASLEYWVKSNRAAIQAGTELLGERFMVLHYDRLCTSPQTEIDRLLAWLGLDVSHINRDELYSLSHVPASLGRRKHHDLSIHRPEYIDAVRELGFPVD